MGGQGEEHCSIRHISNNLMAKLLVSDLIGISYSRYITVPFPE